MIRKELCLNGKTRSLTTCYSSNMWLRFFKHWNQHLVSFEDFKISTDCLSECLKVLVACFETNTWLRFLVIGKYWEFLKTWSVTSILTCQHKPNETLSFKSLIFTLIFHSTKLFFSLPPFLPSLFVLDINYYIRI